MKNDFLCSCSIIIVDADGKSMHKEKEALTLWIEKVEPHVGDILDLGYDIQRKNGTDDGLRVVSLRVLTRKLWFVPPQYTLAPEVSDPENLIHHECCVGSGGAWLSLTCTPTAKNGGREGVKRLLAHYHLQKQLRDRAKRKRRSKR
jgi:hypothetical protein